MNAVAHAGEDRIRSIEGLRRLMPAPRQHLRADDPSVTVVIPAMNEARNLGWLADRMPDGVREIILVDGDSVDDTVAVARRLWPDVRVLGQHRRGKGNALAVGFHAATSDVVVMIDADGSMDPGEIPYFVAALRLGADYAKGSRFCAGGGSGDITRTRALGNRFLNKLTNRLHGSGYTDLCYGYNAFWRHILPVLDLDPGHAGDERTSQKWGDGFEVETLINVRVHGAALSIVEVASYESPRLHGVSNLNAVSDGLRVLRTIAVEHRANRRGDRLRDLVKTVIVEPADKAGSGPAFVQNDIVIDLSAHTSRGLAVLRPSQDYEEDQVVGL